MKLYRANRLEDFAGLGVLGVNGDIIANDRLISSFMHDWKTGFTLSLGEAYTAECIQSLKGSQWERQVMDSTEWAMQQ
jgi:hypothetical protein